MRHLKKFILLISILVALTLIFSFQAKQKNVLHLYTALDPNEAKIYIDAFELDTKIKVDWVRLSAGELLTRVKAEAQRPQASVWFGGSAIEFIAAKKAGLLAPYQSPQAKYLKDDTTLRDSEWYWTGFYFGAIGYACNTKLFEKDKLPEITSWEDLVKPEYKNNISIAYPYTSGTSFTTLATLITIMGEDKAFEYWKKLDANMHHYNTSGSACVTQTGLGEIAIGISFSHDIVTKGIAKGYPIKMVFPKEGTGYEIGSMALIKGGPDQVLGKKFIDWCMTTRCQDLFVSWYRIPLHPDSKVAEGAVKRKDVKLVKMDYDWIGNNQERLIKKWRETIGK